MNAQYESLIMLFIICLNASKNHSYKRVGLYIIVCYHHYTFLKQSPIDYDIRSIRFCMSISSVFPFERTAFAKKILKTPSPRSKLNLLVWLHVQMMF